MPQARIIEALLQHITGGSRSTALKPLGWLLGMLLPATLTSAYLGEPAWLTPTLVALSGGAFVAYVGSYLYLLFRDRDALRSETYSLQKLAIERGLIGDSETGLFDVDTPLNVPLLPAESQEEGGES